MGGDLHLGDDGADAADQEVMAEGAAGGDDHGETRGGQGALDAEQEPVGGAVDAAIAQGGREVEAGEDGAGQTEEGGDASDRGDRAEPAFEHGQFEQGGFGGGGAHGFLAGTGPKERGLDDAGDGSGGFFAGGERFERSAGTQVIADAFDEVGGEHQTAMEEEGAFDDEDQGEERQHEQQPHERAGVEGEGETHGAYLGVDDEPRRVASLLSAVAWPGSRLSPLVRPWLTVTMIE